LLFLSGRGSGGGLSFGGLGYLDSKPGLVLQNDAAGRFGATVEVRAKTGQEPLLVRLAPCGSATVSLVDGPHGARRDLDLVVTPGPPLAAAVKRGALAAEVMTVQGVFDERGKQVPPEIQKGRITFPALIPGATYRLPLPRGAVKEFTAEAGKAVDLDAVPVRDG
jgi:hypothetical protein